MHRSNCEMANFGEAMNMKWKMIKGEKEREREKPTQQYKFIFTFTFDMSLD